MRLGRLKQGYCFASQLIWLNRSTRSSTVKTFWPRRASESSIKP